MLGLVEVFREPELSQFRIMAYRNALAGFDDDAVERAMMEACSTLKFFPKPVELVELIQGKQEDKALTAWEKLQEAVRRAGAYGSPEFDDPKIVRVVQSMAGWNEVCLWPISELHFRRQEFLKAYSALGHGGEETRLIGLHEQQNAALNYDVPVERVKIAGRADRAKLRGNIGAIAGSLVESLVREAS
jgi:hypothetical protein